MERRKRRWWTRGITWLSLIAISGALLSGLFQLAVALAPGYRDDVAQHASTALGQPVEVDGLSLRWRWLWPLLELKGVRLLTVDTRAPMVDVERIRLGFDLTELLRGEWIPADVEVVGVALAAEIGADGRWRLTGRAQGKTPLRFDDVARALQRFSRLRAERVALQVDDLRDAKASFSAVLQKADLRLDAQGFELRAEVQAPDAIASRIRLRAGMSGALATPQAWQGRWTLDASGLAPGAPLHRLLPALAQVQWQDATLTASGDWQQGAPGPSQLALRAQSLTLRDAQPSVLRDVDLGLHYRPSAQGGTLDVVPLRLTGGKGLWPTTTARLSWQRAVGEGASPATMQWRASSNFLRLDDLGPWMAAFIPPRSTLPSITWRSLQGDLNALEARWQPGDAPRYSLHARFIDLAARWPAHHGAGGGSVQGLRGELTADEQRGRLQLDAAPLTFDWPRVLAGTHRASRIAADAQWQRVVGGWQLTVPRFEWSLRGSRGEATAQVGLPQSGSPQLKLQAQFDAEDVAALKPLMPLRWGQPLKDWLGRAVVRGRISKAQLDIHGPLADFPFHTKTTGQWSLRLPVSGARLEYHRDWPGIDQLAATLRFAGNGLSFEVQRGVVNGVAVQAAKGAIADFATEPLVLDAKTRGEAPFYYAFLRASPLADRLQGLLRHSEAEGAAETDVHLEVPLHGDRSQNTIARGEVRLLGNNLRHSALDRMVSDLTGTLRFGGRPAVASDDLRGRFYNTPISARIAPDADGAEVLGVSLRVDLQAADGVAARYVPRWLLPELQGAADWQVQIPLAGPHSGRVRLTSSLVGVRVLLPPPLTKAADDAMPLTLDLSSDDTTALRIAGGIPQRFGLALRFVREPPGLPPTLREAALAIGSGETPALTASRGWQLQGRFDTLEPARWRGLIKAINEGSGERTASSDVLPFLGAQLSAQRVRLAGYELPPLRVEAHREYTHYRATIEGDGVRGALRLGSDGASLSGRFSQLTLVAAPKAGAEAAGPHEAPLDPTRSPTLDIAVDKLHIGQRDFGALTLATERSAQGQRLKKLGLQGGIAALDAEGEWRRGQGMTEAQARFTLTSNDLAGTLEGLGFAATVSGRNARIAGDLTWPAAARGFDWAQGRGTVLLRVEDGALRTVEPGGTGRVLGLLNFYALPRRFALDFADVVSKGLGFDRIEGQFKLANGVARTDDLTVRGPSVRVEVRGDVGLAAHDYDQTITVKPNTKGITLGALLLGGASAVAAPVLPLIAVIANQVVDLPLSQATQLTYRLTGSWDNPEIKKIEASAAAEPPVQEPPTP